MHALRQDLRYAVRLLAKSPGFTAAAVVALALGIGANSAIYSLTHLLLVRPVDYPNVTRLVVVYSTPPDRPDTRRWMSAADFDDIRRQTTSFEILAASDERDFNMTGSDEPVRLQGAVASPGMFEAVGAKPMLGRTFAAEEEQPGRDGVAVLHYDFWRNRFASDPGVVGRTIMLDGRPRTIVGVMGPGFDFPVGSQLWVPYAVAPAQATDRTTPDVSAVGLLKPGVSADQAAAEVQAVASRLAAAYPDTNAGRSAYVRDFRDDVIDPYTKGLLLVLLAAVGLVLLIGCANVANLQLARATGRRREIAVRYALGASRWRVVRQILVESLLVAALGGVVGLVLAEALLDLIRTSIPASIYQYVPGIETLTLDMRLVAVAVAFSAAAGVLAGLVPALQASTADLGEAMKDGSKGAGSGRSSHRTRSALVVSEIALTLTLLVVSGLLVKYFVRIATTSNGYDPRGVLTMSLTLPDQKYADPQQIAAFHEEALRRIAAVPGVESAAAVRYLPARSDGPGVPITIDGRPAPSAAEAPDASLQIVSPGYFAALRIPLLEGRDFTGGDREGAPPVAIISDRTRLRFFPDEDPIGKRVKLRYSDGESPWLTIVGVVGSVKQEWIDPVALAQVYVPLAERPRSAVWLVIRASDPGGIASAVRAEIHGVDPDLPVADVQTLEGVFLDRIAGIRLVTVLMTIFGAMALVLATVGVYAVMAIVVAQRRHEVGIRMALGARPADVLRIVVGQALRMAAIGLLVGLPLGALLGVGLSNVLNGAIPFDPLSVGGFAVMLCAVVAMASFVPARRASRTDPAEVLRSE
jgi:putative ABC transport system permease protein